jgi:hypothetical protein
LPLTAGLLIWRNGEATLPTPFIHGQKSVPKSGPAISRSDFVICRARNRTGVQTRNVSQVIDGDIHAV